MGSPLHRNENRAMDPMSSGTRVAKGLSFTGWEGSGIETRNSRLSYFALGRRSGMPMGRGLAAAGHGVFLGRIHDVKKLRPRARAGAQEPRRLSVASRDRTL